MVEAGEAVAVVAPVEVAPALQIYVVAPPAVKVALVPIQIVGEVTVTVGKGVTVTVASAVPVQPPVVPVTVYVVVVAGVASAVFTPVEEAPAVQVYVVPPLAVKLAVCQLQIVGEFTVTTIAADTVTVATAVPVQPPMVPVTV